MPRPGTLDGLKSLRARRRASSAAAPRSRVVFTEPLEERLLMALAKASGGSGYSGCLSTNPTIRQQQLICDPDEPIEGSTSVSYNPTLVTLAGLEYGPGYGPRFVEDGEFSQFIQGYVEVAGIEGTFLQRIESFLDSPQGIETGYVQVYFELSDGEVGQIAPPEENFIDEIAGVEGVDTHALYFEPVEEDPGDIITIDSHQNFALAAAWDRVVPSYTIFAAEESTHAGNAEDFMITLDGVRLGPADLSPATVTTNAGPNITSLTTNSGSVATAAREGQNVSLTGTFFNVNASDTHGALVNWGDGSTPTTIIPATSPVTAAHAYATGGVYDATLTVVDDDGQSDTETTRVYVAGAGVQGGVLNIIGTGGDDRVEVSTKDTNGDGRDDTVRVSANFLPEYHRQFDLAGINYVHVQAGGGNDKVSVWESVPADSIIEGGDGADTLFAGRRSLLVGGAGADTIVGANGNDALISGITAYAGNFSELLAILNGLEATIINDFAVDTVTGNRGADTFYLNTGDVLKDSYLGRDGVERFFVDNVRVFP